MTNISKDAMLGAVFSEDKIKLIEVDSSAGNQFRINKITENKLDFPFTIQSIIEGKHIDEYADQLRELIDRYGFTDQRAAISLANNMVIIKKYPYDANFSDNEIVDQVDWEVQQFSYSKDDDYIIDYQKLNLPRNKGKATGEMIVVAVREAIIKYIKQLFAKAKVKLRVVDTDIFAAIRAINVNYECREGDVCALISIEKKGIQFTIIDSGEFYLSHYFAYKTPHEDVTSDDIITLISKELRRLILDNKLGEKIEDLNRIFLYGEVVKDDVLESLQNTYNVRIDRANPFRRLRFAHNVSVDEYIWSRPETFTVCVGSALR